jgi:hypothetical protein
MSVWASIPGDEPTIYDPVEGDRVDPDGWIDVAVSPDRARIIIEDSGGAGEISLDRYGLAELHRRITIARDRLRGDVS